MELPLEVCDLRFVQWPGFGKHRLELLGPHDGHVVNAPPSSGQSASTKHSTPRTGTSGRSARAARTRGPGARARSATPPARASDCWCWTSPPRSARRKRSTRNLHNPDRPGRLPGEEQCGGGCGPCKSPQAEPVVPRCSWRGQRHSADASLSLPRRARSSAPCPCVWWCWRVTAAALLRAARRRGWESGGLATLAAPGARADGPWRRGSDREGVRPR